MIDADQLRYNGFKSNQGDRMQKDIIKAQLAYETGATVLSKFERLLMITVLEKFEGNQTYSARNMGISRTTFRLKMKRHGISPVYQ